MFDGLTRLRDALRPRARITDADWDALIASSALFARRPAVDRDALRALAERFLAKKRFSAAGGHVLEPAQCLAIAAIASLPVLRLGFDALAGWREVIVYPGEFRVKREHHDEHSGVVTEGEEDLIGEAWERGPLVLSWADVATDLARPFDMVSVALSKGLGAPGGSLLAGSSTLIARAVRATHPAVSRRSRTRRASWRSSARKRSATARAAARSRPRR